MQRPESAGTQGTREQKTGVQEERQCQTHGPRPHVPEDLADEKSVESQEAEQSHAWGQGDGGAMYTVGLRRGVESLQHPWGQGRTSRLNISGQSCRRSRSQTEPMPYTFSLEIPIYGAVDS